MTRVSTFAPEKLARLSDQRQRAIGLRPEEDSVPEESDSSSKPADWLLVEVRELPAQERLVLVSRYWGDLKVEEIASLLRLTRVGVYKILRRAEALLAERIRDARSVAAR